MHLSWKLSDTCYACRRSEDFENVLIFLGEILIFDLSFPYIILQFPSVFLTKVYKRRFPGGHLYHSTSYNDWYNDEQHNSLSVSPSDQISAGAPYPLCPLSITSGAMYWRVPVKVAVLSQIPPSLLLVPKSDIFTTPL